MKTGSQLIAEERERQIKEEGFIPEEDKIYINVELSNAAVCYIASSQATIMRGIVCSDVVNLWPWEPNWWKPSKDPIRDLVKAGALIAAEIDRLQKE